MQVVVTNLGQRPSREVVQLYLEPADPDQPIRLIGWQGVVVNPAETARVVVSSESWLWRRWDVDHGGWTDLPRAGRLLVARGLGDIRGTITL